MRHDLVRTVEHAHVAQIGTDDTFVQGAGHRQFVERLLAVDSQLDGGGEILQCLRARNARDQHCPHKQHTRERQAVATHEPAHVCAHEIVSEKVRSIHRLASACIVESLRFGGSGAR